MPTTEFSSEVISQLKWYVYRLIDPRNGETFYVGKGQRNRVFPHANGLVDGEEGEVSDPKLQRIRDIRATGLEVGNSDFDGNFPSPFMVSPEPVEGSNHERTALRQAQDERKTQPNADNRRAANKRSPN